MEKGKEYKIQYLKQNNPELHGKVISGEMNLTDAYNETQRIKLGLTGYRGRNTKKKEFATDFKRIIALHNPSQQELIEEIKKAFPLTWKEFIQI